MFKTIVYSIKVEHFFGKVAFLKVIRKTAGAIKQIRLHKACCIVQRRVETTQRVKQNTLF